MLPPLKCFIRNLLVMYKVLVGFLFVFTCLAVGCTKTEEALFVPVNTGKSNMDFVNGVVFTNDLNIVEYLYAYNGGGVAIGDINNDGLPDVYLSANQLENRLYLNKGNMVFEDVTMSAGVEGIHGEQSWTTGVTMADVNSDGYLDIYVSMVSDYKHLKGHNLLYINNKDLTFTESSEEYGLDIKGFGQQAYFFDYDMDGDLDVYQLRHAVHKPEVYQGPLARRLRDDLSGDLLLKNEGDTFVDVSDEAGIYGGAAGYGLSAAISDLDGNGCPDIYVSNDFHENDFVYYNQCDGTFLEKGNTSTGHTSRFSMGMDIADINNDGLSDIFTVDMKPFDEAVRKRSANDLSPEIYEYSLGFGYHHQYSRNMLQLNRGNILGSTPRFSEIAQYQGLDATDWSWGPLFADFDNDGRKDLLITNGILRRPNDLDYINFAYNDYSKRLSDLELSQKMPDGAVSNFAFRNTEGLVFEDVSAQWGLDYHGYSMGASYADLDNDGDLDIIVNNLNAAVSLYENHAQDLHDNNYLKIRLVGPKDNRDAVGAKVTLAMNDGSVQTIEQYASRGWLSSVGPSVHFGWGQGDSVDHLEVLWPDGKIQTLNDLGTNAVMDIDYKDSHPGKKGSKGGKKTFESREFGDSTYIHEITYQSDFTTERLLLQKLSTEGPKMAVGDVNGDGLSDFYLCGPAMQEGRLYVQDPNADRWFFKKNPPSFATHGHYEDTDAVFFDFDADGDLDLFVLSGHGTDPDSKPLNRIYVNDGKGNFEFFNGDYPADINGSTVLADDFDFDGNTDLFIGVRYLPGKYGTTSKSSILWNEGNGKLVADRDVDRALHMGMVTDAVFLRDKKQLVVVGEWMPITFVSFEDREFTVHRMDNTTGWWNTVHAEDMDRDNDLDLIVGNQGTNSGFQPTSDHPLGLYVNDFDGNGSTDLIFTYWKEGKEWPYEGLDELKGQMVSLRKQYNTYGDFASVTISELLTEPMGKGMEYKSAQMLESVWLENIRNKEFVVRLLPDEVQWAPVYGVETGDFDGDDNLDIVAIGNNYGFRSSIGRADASYGNFLKGDGKGGFSSVPPELSGWVVPGEPRDVKWLNRKKGHPILLVTRKNDAPLLMEVKGP